MTTLYKLMSADNKTHGETAWGHGVTHGPLTGKGNLCGPGWFHAYTHPLLAVLFDPIHGDFGKDAILRRAEGAIGKNDHGIKVGCRSLTTLERVPLPVISATHRMAFTILISLEIDQPIPYREWARSWLDGVDRSTAAAESMAMAMAETWTLAAVATIVAEAEAARPWTLAAVAATLAEVAATVVVEMALQPIDLIAIAKRACWSDES